MLKQIGAQNAEVIVSDVGESRPTFHITQRVDASNVRFQLPIDLDVPLLVQLYASGFGREIFGVGYTAGCRQQMRAGQLLFTLRRAHGQLHAPTAELLNLLRRRSGQDRDSILAQNLRYGVTHVFILAHKQARTALNERDLAAKATKHLSELQRDVAATDDEQMFGERVQLHNRG